MRVETRSLDAVTPIAPTGTTFGLSFDFSAPLATPRAELRWAAVAARIVRAGGARALFRGFVPCVLRSLPVNAVTFFVYEETLLLFRDAA